MHVFGTTALPACPSVWRVACGCTLRRHAKAGTLVLHCRQDRLVELGLVQDRRGLQSRRRWHRQSQHARKEVSNSNNSHCSAHTDAELQMLL